jgi:hypothetical protein
LFSSRNIVLVVKSEKVVLMGYAVCVGEKHEDLENQGVEVRIILKRILKETGSGCTHLVTLAQDREKWRAAVNTVTDLQNA